MRLRSFIFNFDKTLYEGLYIKCSSFFFAEENITNETKIL